MPMLTGRQLRIAVTLAALIWPGVSAFALDSVKVGKSVNQNMLFAAVEVGQAAKIWESFGITTTSVALGGDAKVQQALATNDVQFGLGGGPALAFRAKGAPAAGIAPLDTTANLDIVVRPDSPIKVPQDLKGKLVGVTTAGSLTDWLVREFSRKMGWGPEGVRIAPLGDPRARYAALKTGAIDGITMPTEAAYQFQIKKQGRIVVPFPDYVPKIHSLMMFTSDRLIADNPDLVQRFVNGYFATLDYMKKNKEQSARIISQVTGLSEEAILDAWDVEFRSLSDRGRFDPAALDTLRNSFKELGLLNYVPEAKDIYVGRFVPAKF